MDRFLSTNAHSRQGSDKWTFSRQDWFSKSTVEPSRQALNDMMRKDNTRPSTPDGQSDSTAPITKTGSTMLDLSESQHESIYRPMSRQSNSYETSHSPERSQNAARKMISRSSRMMRKKSSKLSLFSPHSDNATSPATEKLTTDTSLQSRDRPQSFVPNRTSSKPNISSPFGFQHLTHTNHGHFLSLNQVAETDLETDFTALQAEQQPETKIKGIPVGDLPKAVNVSLTENKPCPPSPTVVKSTELPLTPPRPPPPPKDSVDAPRTPPNMRLSRSMENFSRLTRPSGSPPEPLLWGTESARNSMLNSAAALSSALMLTIDWTQSTPESNTSDTKQYTTSNASNSSRSSPASSFTDIVHAVTTPDHSYLQLPVAPLPEIPQPVKKATEGQTKSSKTITTPPQPPRPRRSSLRHMRTFPSPKSYKRNSQSLGSNENALPQIPEITKLPANGSKSKPRHKPKKTSTVGLNRVDIENWEDAIDYSWDHDLTLEQPADDHDICGDGIQEHACRPLPALPSRTSTGSHPYARSAPSSPPASNARIVTKDCVDDEQLPSPTCGRNMPNILKIANEEDSSGLIGLGIDSHHDYAPQHLQSVSHVNGALPPSQNDGLSRSPHVRRDRGSPMSKSSSQESIILSIASSIMSTHRSSNSTNSLSDLCHFINYEENSTQDDSLQINDHEENNSDGSQETLRTDPKAQPATILEEPSSPSLEPTTYTRVAPNSTVSIPDRTSSMTVIDSNHSPEGRKRSKTLGYHSRHRTRSSYSLFPSSKTTGLV